MIDDAQVRAWRDRATLAADDLFDAAEDLRRAKIAGVTPASADRLNERATTGLAYVADVLEALAADIRKAMEAAQ